MTCNIDNNGPGRRQITPLNSIAKQMLTIEKCISSDGMDTTLEKMQQYVALCM